MVLWLVGRSVEQSELDGTAVVVRRHLAEQGEGRLAALAPGGVEAHNNDGIALVDHDALVVLERVDREYRWMAGSAAVGRLPTRLSPMLSAEGGAAQGEAGPAVAAGHS